MKKRKLSIGILFIVVLMFLVILPLFLTKSFGRVGRFNSASVEKELLEIVSNTNSLTSTPFAQSTNLLTASDITVFVTETPTSIPNLVSSQSVDASNAILMLIVLVLQGLIAIYLIRLFVMVSGQKNLLANFSSQIAHNTTSKIGNLHEIQQLASETRDSLAELRRDIGQVRTSVVQESKSIIALLQRTSESEFTPFHIGSPKEKSVAVYIYEKDLQYIRDLVSSSPDLEIGGDLFGFWSYSGMPIIEYVLGPGPQSRRSPVSFYQDEKFLQKIGEHLNGEHGLQHIGEWHSHHNMHLFTPSDGDIRTVRKAVELYSLPRFVLCIANIQNGVISVRPYIIDKASYSLAEWKILKGQSPFQNSKQTLQYNVDDQAITNANVWYETPEGKKFLQMLDEMIRASFETVELKRNIHGGIYYSIHTGKAYITINFPNDFPASAALITDGINVETLPVTGTLKSLASQAQLILDTAKKLIGG